MTNKTFIMLLLSVLSVTAASREKRSVLHSDTDIVAKVLEMESEISSLTSTIANMNASHNSEMAKVNNDNTKQAQEIQGLRASLTQTTRNDHGSTYTRWGRSLCPGNGTQLVYKGYMGGKHFNNGGGGANHLCLPEDPTWGKFDDGNQAGDRGYVFGTEYSESGDVIFGKHVYDQDVPCAVCKTPGISMMIPARTNCYSGWNLEYTGYMVSGYQGRSSPSDYVCVDADPEFIFRGGAEILGHRLYLVEAICGTLPCPPYVNYRELACSVCSK